MWAHESRNVGRKGVVDHSFPPWIQQEVTSRGRGFEFREEKTKVVPILSKIE